MLPSADAPAYSAGMKPSPLRDLLVLFALASSGVLLGSCASERTRASTSQAKPSATSSPQAATTAKQKLDIATLELSIAEAKQQNEVYRREQELDLAKSELAQFDERDAPNRTARSELDLQRGRDTLAEQEEELAQLQMTYADVDLADKTREIVLNRNQRRVARAKDALLIQERESETLKTRVLPRERAKLALDVESKTRELESTRRDADLELRRKRMAIDDAKREVEKLEGAAPQT